MDNTFYKLSSPSDHFPVFDIMKITETENNVWTRLLENVKQMKLVILNLFLMELTGPCPVKQNNSANDACSSFLDLFTNA